MDYAEARRRMVDGQLRPSQVTDPRLLAVLGDLPRERFLPPALRARAYLDEDVLLPGGRALLEPVVLARLVQLLEVRPGHRALVVPAGAGYGSAVLGRLGAQVVAVESDAALREATRGLLAELLPAGAVQLHDGPPAEGARDAGPFDVVLVEGGVADIPPALAEQLAEGGRLAAVVGGPRGGRAVLGRRSRGTLTQVAVFDCAVPALPDFRPAAGFVFG